MDITFFRFNIKPEYWEAVEKYLKENEVTENELRNCLMHTSTNFVIEKCTRFYSDHVIDLKDSYSIQSQRYVNFKDKFDFFYTPEEIGDKGYSKIWENHINDMIKIYSELVDNGINPEDARFALPVTFFSNAKVTLQGDKLIDFINFNYNYSAFDEHRAILDKFLKQFDAKYQILIDKLIALAKHKNSEFNKDSKSNDLWKHMFKPGELGVFIHNDMVFESSLGASICYRAGSPSEYIEKFGEEKQVQLLEKILESKHESVTEHAFLTIQIPISRIIHSHFQRHRLAKRSYTSTIQAAEKFSYVIPPDIQANEKCLQVFEEGMRKCKEIYDKLVSYGVSKENACYALPNALKIDTIITTNIRDIKHIMRTRLCERAHWEIRGLVYKIFKELYQKTPLLLSDLGPSCYLGKCKEGTFSCGKPYVFKDFLDKLK